MYVGVIYLQKAQVYPHFHIERWEGGGRGEGRGGEKMGMEEWVSRGWEGMVEGGEEGLTVCRRYILVRVSPDLS